MKFLENCAGLALFSKGEILENRNGVKYVYTFKLLGSTYVSNVKRKNKYKFDDAWWCVHKNSNLVTKLKMIYNKQVVKKELK